MTTLSRELDPDEFLLWWFENAESHGLSDSYRMFYSNYFDSRGLIPYVWSHFSRRIRHLKKIDLQGKRFLDVGCGLGTEALWASLRGAETTGIELHQDSLDIAKLRADILTRNFAISVEFKDMNLLDLDGQYDVIFLRESFHHLEPRSAIVEKLAHLLHRGGMLIIEETNGFNPILQLKYLYIRGWRTVVTKYRADGVHYLFGNERITTGTNLDALFRKYEILGRTDYFRLLPTAFAKIGLIAAAATYVERIFNNAIFLRPFYLHYSWIGKRTSLFRQSSDCG